MYLVFVLDYISNGKTKRFLQCPHTFGHEVYIVRASGITEAWTAEAKVKNTSQSESAISWPALFYVTWWIKSIQRPGNDDPRSALWEIELTSIVLMNRLARGVSSISSNCSSIGACLPFCVSVSHSHAVYNSLFTQPVHPSFSPGKKLWWCSHDVAVLVKHAHSGVLKEKGCPGWAARWCQNHKLIRKLVTYRIGDDECSWYTCKKSACLVWWGKKTRWSATNVSKQ